MKARHLVITPLACFAGLICAAFVQDLTSGPSRYSMWEWMPVSLIALVIPPLLIFAWCVVRNPRPRPFAGFLVGAGTFALVELLDQAWKLHEGIIGGIYCFLPLVTLILWDRIQKGQ